jgi:SurA N-terminal domain
MIENIRKYRGLIIFALVLVAVALVIGMQSDILGKSSGHRDLFRISGRSYSDTEFQRLGEGGYQLASSLGQSGDFDFLQYAMAMTTNPYAPDASQKFFVGRMVLRDAMPEFGVHPGDEEISAYIRKMRFFAGTDQQFSEEKFRTFEKSIGHLGLTETDLRELVADLLSFKKVNSIIGSGLTVNRDVTALTLALTNQEISGALARLDLDPFEANIEPTEDEIKAYWENIKDQFSTAPLRKFSYLIVTPDIPTEEAENKDGKPDSIVEAAATDEAKKKLEAEKAKKTADLAEARRKKQLESDAAVDQFSVDLEDSKGKGFEELAKANKWEIKTTELFAQKSPPKELDISLRASSRGGKAVDELFRIEPTSDPLSSYSQPIAIGENQWLIGRLDGKEDARTKTYEEARFEARDQFIQEKATEAMKKAATEALEKIKSSVTAGKSFADAAKEAGINQSKEFSKVTTTYRADASTEPANLFEATRNVDPGSFAEIITEKDRTFIVHVAKREVVKEENAAARLDSEVKSQATRNEMVAFTGWIASRTEAAKVEELFKN